MSLGLAPICRCTVHYLCHCGARNVSPRQARRACRSASLDATEEGFDKLSLP